MGYGMVEVPRGCQNMSAIPAEPGAGLRALTRTGNREEELMRSRPGITACHSILNGFGMSAPQVTRPDSLAAQVRQADWLSLILSLRCEQWLKNLLVFVPLMAGHRFYDGVAWLNTVGCFLLFSIGASGQYLINDVVDFRWDRQDPHKSRRPIAAGRIHRGRALAVGIFFVTGCTALSWLLPAGAFTVMVLYHVSALAYTFGLKRVPILDVVLLATLYGMRVFAGGATAVIRPSEWLLAFTLFLFLSLALLKRVAELPAGPASSLGRGFRADDRTFLIIFGLNTGMLSVVVLTLYVQSPIVALLYRRPQVLCLLAVVLTYWVAHTWLRAVRGEFEQGLWISLAKDRVGYLALITALLIFFLAI